MRKELFLWRGALLLSILFILSVGWIVFDDLFAPFGERSESVEIPNLCGLLAENVIYPDWADVELEYRHDASAPNGVILSQEPKGGSLRKLTAQNPRLTLTLFVSLGEESLRVPSLLGLDHREAAARLRALGLSVEEITQTGAYPAGEVFATEPRADTQIPVGSRVVLYVSAGQPQKSVKVPDLTGLSRSDALVRLWLSELSLGAVLEVDSPLPVGTVIGQSHRKGSLVTAGTQIDLTVSREQSPPLDPPRDQTSNSEPSQAMLTG